jgi:putative ABC transport system permease protein
MNWLSQLLSRRRFYSDLSAEIQTHLDEKTDELVASGMSPHEAREAARREFGNSTLLEENGREVWRWRVLEDFLRDLRFGVRMLRTNPGFTASVVLTLALGIGVNTAIFSVIDAALLRPLPYPEPDRIVSVYLLNEEKQDDTMAPADFLDFERASTSFSHLGAYREIPLNLSGHGEPERVQGAMVTSDFFSVFGVNAFRGRTISPQIEHPGVASVAVIGFGLWQRKFGGDPGIIGKAADIDGEMRTIVGVMPQGFSFPAETELWTSSRFAMIPHPLRPQEDPSALRDIHYFDVVGRLKPNLTMTQATAEADAIARRLKQQYPNEEEAAGARVISLRQDLVGETRPALLILLGAVALVLLIACVNVANIVLARGATRQQEIAIRRTLGADRATILRQLLIEAMVLAVCGGALGGLFAQGAMGSLRSLVPASMLAGAPLTLNIRVLTFAGIATLLSGLLFGLVPGLRLSRWTTNDALKEGGRGSAQGRGALRTRRALVVSEIALATILLIAAGLLIRSFSRLLAVSTGFQPDRVLSLELSLPQARYNSPIARAAFMKSVLGHADSLPGIEFAGAVSRLPLNPGNSTRSLDIQGRTAEKDDLSPDYLVASPAYFQTMGIPLRNGRAFTDRDSETGPPVAIVTQAMADYFWPGRDPIGQRLRISNGSDQDPWSEVVGVVGDIRQHHLERNPRPALYVPYAQDPWPFVAVVVRTKVDPASAASSVQSAIHAVDPDQPVYDVRTMKEVESVSIAPQRLQLILLGLFAILALALACTGIYGVMAYFVVQRTREIGVRMALGAQARDVIGMIVGEGLRMALLGAALGLLGSAFLMRVLSGLLFGVTPRDPLTFCAVAAILTGVALLACYIPARRATVLDPLVALRYE